MESTPYQEKTNEEIPEEMKGIFKGKSVFYRNNHISKREINNFRNGMGIPYPSKKAYGTSKN